MKVDEAKQFIDSVATWAAGKISISGLLLVGSYAHGTARPDSDIDFVLLTSEMQDWLTSTEWLKSFGKLDNVEFEDWGGVKTQRATFHNSFEVEFNFAAPDWACSDPIDPGTLRVVSDGAKVLYDPRGYLNRLVEAVRGAQVEQ